MQRLRLPEVYHRYLYLAGLLMGIIGMPLSKFLLSLSLFWIGINWAWEGQLAEKMKRLRSSKAIWMLLAVFALHLAGMFYTEHTKDGWSDIRVKLPMLLTPFFIGTSRPLNRREFLWLMGLFAAAVILSTIITFIRALSQSGNIAIDIRNASRFVPLIRLGLMVVLSVFTLFYLVFTQRSLVLRLASIASIVWFVFFLVYMQALTGLIILAFTSFVMLCVYAFRFRKRLLIAGLFLVFSSGLTFAFLEVRKAYLAFSNPEKVDWEHLEIYSPDGGIYFHYPNHHMMENGHFVMAYISWSELEESWGRRSRIPFEGNDHTGNLVRYTLLRYMSSKGLRKDASGMRKLSDADIHAVEAGCTNYLLPQMTGIERRLYQVFWEWDVYLNGGDPTGNSVTMRLEFWRASEALIAEHPYFGVGTGDGQKEMIQKLMELGTQLGPEYFWMHSHNQFLSIAIAFGLPGLFLFLLSLFGPPLLQRRFGNYFYLAFFCLVVFSFLNEDTFETSQGMMFYAFFNCLLLFAQPVNGHEPVSQEPLKAS